MAGDRKKLKDWSVKEFISGYGDVITDLNVDLTQEEAYFLVLNYELQSSPHFEEKNDDCISDFDDSIFDNIPQY